MSLLLSGAPARLDGDGVNRWVRTGLGEEGHQDQVQPARHGSDQRGLVPGWS